LRSARVKKLFVKVLVKLTPEVRNTVAKIPHTSVILKPKKVIANNNKFRNRKLEVPFDHPKTVNSIKIKVPHTTYLYLIIVNDNYFLK